MSAIGRALRLLTLGLLLLVMVPIQLVSLRYGWRLAGTLPVLFHRCLLRLFGVRVVVRGTPPGDAPTLVLANHVSWLDIPVIGSLRPLSFIAKTEVNGWPGIGLLARLQRTVFIDRTRKTATAKVNATVAHRLARGEVIVLFPEGTTGDGNRLLPFRSSLVGAARLALTDPGPEHRTQKWTRLLGSIRCSWSSAAHRSRRKTGSTFPHDALEHIVLQPLAVAYVRRGGLPVTRRERPTIAWYGDMDLVPHLSHFLREGPLDAVVTWGEPIPFDSAADRKRAAAAAEAAVRRAILRPTG